MKTSLMEILTSLVGAITQIGSPITRNPERHFVKTRTRRTVRTLKIVLVKTKTSCSGIITRPLRPLRTIYILSLPERYVKSITDQHLRSFMMTLTRILIPNCLIRRSKLTARPRARTLPQARIREPILRRRRTLTPARRPQRGPSLRHTRQLRPALGPSLRHKQRPRPHQAQRQEPILRLKQARFLLHILAPVRVPILPQQQEYVARRIRESGTVPL
jgi:hypothetical protein